jgi:hypothetical protein
MNDPNGEKTQFRHHVHGTWSFEVFFRMETSEGNGMPIRNPNGKTDAKVITIRFIK